MAEEEEKELHEFCELMNGVHYFGMCKKFKSGSSAEVRNQEGSVAVFADETLTDVDMMIYFTNVNVYNVNDLVPSQYRGEMFRYATDRSHLCYCHIVTAEQLRHTVNLAHQAEQYGATVHGPAVKLLNKELATEIDSVFARHSPYFPHESVEWISRQRSHDSTSQNIIRRVVGYGCDFVNVAHKLNNQVDKVKEFRFSFSLAELMLIKNWSTQQRIVYRVVRVLYKMSLNKGKRASHLCTYYFKTLMLWAVGTRPHRSWDDIRDSTRHILLEMIRCLKNKCLPHYFIPSNNLLDHLNTINLTDDMRALRNLVKTLKVLNSQRYRNPYEHLHSGTILLFILHEELNSLANQQFYILPSSISRSLCIFSTWFLYDCASSALYNHTGISKRMFNSLNSTKELMTNLILNPTERSISLLNSNFLFNPPPIKKSFTAKENYPFYIQGHTARTMFPIYERISGFSREIFLSQFSSLIRSSKRTQSRWKTSQKEGKRVYKLYDVLTTESSRRKMIGLNNSNSMKGKDGISYEIQRENGESVSSRITDSEKHKHFVINTFKPEPIEFFLKSDANCLSFKPGFSPTVPVSWYINKAYTANHYYTLLSDHKTTEKICDTIIGAYNESEGNSSFAEHGLPVLLSTRWIKMYDREIQKLLGLSALCRFVTHESGDRSVHLPVTPILFALYLKIRCVINIDGALSVKLETEVMRWFDHQKQKQLYEHLPPEYLYGHRLLHCSLQAYYELNNARELENYTFNL